MNEIEDLVQASIIILNESQNKALDKRTLMWNLYSNIQNNFDCSFTYFRVKDILLQNSFLYTISIYEHPDYNDYISYFNKLKYKDFEYIRKIPTQKYDRNTNPTTSFYVKDENRIFFFYGSLLWKRLIRKNEPYPKNLDVFEIALIMMAEAETLQHIDLIYEWYAFIINFYDWFSGDRDFEILKEKYFIEMKDIFLRTKARKSTKEHYPSLHINNKDELKDLALYLDKELLKIKTWFIE